MTKLRVLAQESVYEPGSLPEVSHEGPLESIRDILAKTTELFIETDQMESNWDSIDTIRSDAIEIIHLIDRYVNTEPEFVDFLEAADFDLGTFIDALSAMQGSLGALSIVHSRGEPREEGMSWEEELDTYGFGTAYTNLKEELLDLYRITKEPAPDHLLEEKAWFEELRDRSVHPFLNQPMPEDDDVDEVPAPPPGKLETEQTRGY